MGLFSLFSTDSKSEIENCKKRIENFKEQIETIKKITQTNPKLTTKKVRKKKLIL